MKELSLKVEDIVEINNKKYNVAKIMETGDFDNNKFRQCKEFALHELGSKSLFPTDSLLKFHDNNQLKFNGKEINIEDIKLIK